MLISMSLALEILSILVFGSIIFVWGIRYNNIKDEFKHFQLPNWLRDLVGILKLSFAVMLFSDNLEIVQIGAYGNKKYAYEAKNILNEIELISINEVYSASNPTKLLHSVISGPFENRSAANNAKEQITKNGFDPRLRVLCKKN